MKLKRISTPVAVLLAAIVTGIWSAIPARAGFAVSFPTAITAASGTTGNSFDVDVTNLLTTVAVIDSFAFEVAVSSPNITLTSTTVGTRKPYIFAGDSLFGPILSTLPLGQSIDGSDISASGADYSLAGGATVAIGEVFFDVAPGPAAVYTLSFSPTTATSFSDSSGNAFAIDFLTPGTITVSTVPEPSSISLVALAIVGLTFVARKKFAALLIVRGPLLDLSPLRRNVNWR